MSEPALPIEIASSTVTIMGVELTVHVLDNGQRVIGAAGMEALFEGMASGAPLTEDDAMKIATVMRTR